MEEPNLLLANLFPETVCGDSVDPPLGGTNLETDAVPVDPGLASVLPRGFVPPVNVILCGLPAGACCGGTLGACSSSGLRNLSTGVSVFLVGVVGTVALVGILLTVGFSS